MSAAGQCEKRIIVETKLGTTTTADAMQKNLQQRKSTTEFNGGSAGNAVLLRFSLDAVVGRTEAVFAEIAEVRERFVKRVLREVVVLEEKAQISERLLYRDQVRQLYMDVPCLKACAERIHVDKSLCILE
ncbi:hypothetical protein R69888_05585 [Paraburkholderia haematera]|jgi:hypothetical protein|uniref:Uncharacterized protein n=1 Tax=Paraburkholderia haematera TaxID=2793077 RepID=A0ABM8SH34_9BURK|nr:hypothetical protein R69888_05585 [Paraburkholderia haematera]